MKIMPETHKLLFENRFVRVIEGKVPAGGYEPRHRHPNNVMVYLADFDAEVKTCPNGEWIRIASCLRDGHLERSRSARSQDYRERTVAYRACRTEVLNY